MVNLSDGIEKYHSNKAENMDSDVESDEEIVVSRSKLKNSILSDGASSDNDDDTIFSSTKGRLLCINSDSESDNDQLKNDINNIKNKVIYKYDNTIFDTEISDDEMKQDDRIPTLNQDSDTDTCIPKDDSNMKKSMKKKVKSNKHKEQESNMQKIHSESQRMIRETEISLPYHRPKQRSLADFLNRNTKCPPSKKNQSLKMSMRDMNILRQIENQKKDLHLFYESESDEEETEIEESLQLFDSETESKLIIDPAVSSGAHSIEGNLHCLERKSNFNCSELESQLSCPEIESDLPCLEVESEISPEIESEVSPEVESEIYPEIESELSCLEKKCRINHELVTDAAIKTNILLDMNTELIDNNLDKQIDKSDILSSKAETVNNNEIVHESMENVAKSTIEVLEKSSESTNSSLDSKNIVDEIMTVPDTDSFNLSTENKFVSIDDPQKLKITNEIDVMDEDFKLQLEAEEMDDLSLQFTEDTEHFDRVSPSLNLNTRSLQSIISKYPGFDVSKLSNSTPRLSGSVTDHFIELDVGGVDIVQDNKSNKSGASLLIERLVKHSIKKKKNTEMVELSIVSKEKNIYGEEKLISSKIFFEKEGDINEGCNAGEESVPGARFVKLKTALKAELMKQRGKDIIRREKEKKFFESEEVMEEFDDDLPDDEEIALTDKSDTEYETESEPEENDVVIKDTKRSRNQYLDDEADDTGDENDANVDNEMSDQSDYEDTIETKKELTFISDDDDSLLPPDSAKQVSRRILEENQDEKIELEITRQRNLISRASTEDMFFSQPHSSVGRNDTISSSLSMNTSLELIGSQIPGAQPESCSKNIESDSFTEDEFNHSSLSLFSKLDNFKRVHSNKESDTNHHLNLPMTPMKNSQYRTISERNDINFVLNNEDFSSNQDDLVGLCSGRFSGLNKKVAEDLGDDQFAPTQDVNELAGLCSGFFDDQRQKMNSQGFQQPTSRNQSRTGMSNNDDSEKLPAASKLKMQVLSSDDDDEFESNKGGTNRTKRKRKRIVNMSDEEDNDAVSMASLTDDEEIEYDDDERPIVKRKFRSFMDKRKGTIRSDFLDKEAELSGSEGGSGDEDEPDEEDDLMEREDGDNEYFDEDELRNEIGRAHMKSMMDTDKRELKLLQELYFEDGDLHGKGRRKNFRWRDNDKETEDDNEDNQCEEPQTEEEAAALEEAAERRKLKLERQKSVPESDASNEKSPSVMNLFALKTCHSLPIVRTRSANLLRPSNSTPSACSPFLAGINSTRPRSFFLRDPSTSGGGRVSDKMKENTTTVKRSGNFVFHSLTAEEVEKKEARDREHQQKVPPTKKSRVERSFFAVTQNSNDSVFLDL